ncbi:MAG: hypothetical protein JJE13_01560 [Thermoleophilia bacterium]|nr:hypothetical protein [Thermoleophilia bacterium]
MLRTHPFPATAVQTLNFAGISSDAAYDLALDAQGRTVMSGYSTQAGPSSFAVARLKADGEPDLTLSGTGHGIPDVGGTFSIGSSVAIDAEGRILIAGGLADGAVTNFLVIRLRPEGSFDPSFHGNGRVIVDFATAPEESAAEVLIDAQKRIVLAGYVRQALNTPYDTAIARLTPDGALDQTFSGDGRVTTGTPESDYTRSATLDPAGRIITSGSLVNAETFAGDALMMRFGTNGAFDQSFGENGFLFDDFFAPEADGWGIAVDGQGRYVMAGRSVGGAEDRTSLARYTVDYPKPPDPDPNPAGIKCAGVAATISGTPGKDTLKGTKKLDVITGLGGNDVIKGLSGNDLVCGGNGNDNLVGGPGNDNLVGGPGNDNLVGGPGNDTLHGDGGKDTLTGGPGKDRLIGGKGKDICKGGPGKNRLKTCEPARRRR